MPLLFVVSVLTFVLVAVTPGDAARAILGLTSTEEQYQRLRHEFGLDEPVYEQYWQWLTGALHGDFGSSLVNNQDVTTAITARLPVTLSLALLALLLSQVVGIGLGLFSAVKGGVAGRIVDVFSLTGNALPSYWLGAMLIFVFAVKLAWFPAIGYTSWSHSPTGWLRSLALPVIALSLFAVGGIARQTRDAMLDALSSDYIRMARARGVSSTSVIFRHAFRNAAPRVVTIFSLELIGLLGGAVFIETLFGLPGVGQLAVGATSSNDLPMVQGVVVFFTLVVVSVNLITDLVYTWLDPRVRTG